MRRVATRSHCVSIHSKLFRGCSVQIRADHCLSTAFLMIASPRRSLSWLCFAVPSLLIAKLISGVLCLRTALSIFAKLIPCFSARRSPAPPYAIQIQCCVLPSKAPLPLCFALHVHCNSLLCTAFHPQIISASCLSRPLQIASLLIGAVPVHLCATYCISYHPQFASDPCSSKPLQFVFFLIGAVLYLCISHFHASYPSAMLRTTLLSCACASFLCVSLRFSAFPLRFTGLLCSRLLRCAPAQSAAHPPSGTGRSSPPPWATR